jgi:glucosamine-6-phosphate deaminase
MTFTYDLAEFIDFRDRKGCERVRNLSRSELLQHANPDVSVRVIDDTAEFYLTFALDIVLRIQQALEEGRSFVAILPVGPMPQYQMAAQLINMLRVPLHHVHTFNMDEYANEHGQTAPVDWPGSFQRAMMEGFFSLIDPELRHPAEQIHFPTEDVIDHYGELMQEVGGVDVCYGGIGWCGHIAFWESHLGHEFGDDLDAFRQAAARLVTLHPMTIMQNALHSFSGDWSLVPPKANTIGPAEVLSSRECSFWLDGHILGNIAWQRFIARLVIHGPITPLVPGSILQTTKSTFTLLGGVAEDITIVMK